MLPRDPVIGICEREGGLALASDRFMLTREDFQFWPLILLPQLTWVLLVAFVNMCLFCIVCSFGISVCSVEALGMFAGRF